MALDPGSIPCLPPGCPWSDWTPPNIKWCEENLCGWITTPANTWSNLAYLVAGLLILRKTRELRAEHLAGLGPAVLVMGLSSFLYHASFTLFFQFWDFVGMFLVLFIFIALDFRRMGVVGPSGQRRVYWLGVTGFSALVVAMHGMKIHYQGLIAFLVAGLLLQEAWLRHRWPGNGPAGSLLRAVGFLAVATVFTVLDITRSLCSPGNHIIQGHALWHVFSAVAIYHAHDHYARLPPGTRDR